MTEFEKMISGQLYNSADPELDAFHRICKDKMHAYNQMRSSDVEGRAKAIKNILGSCGQNINIEPPFYIDYGCNIHVGENFYANYGVTILDVAPVTIGKNCFIGPGAGLFAAGHPLNVHQRCELMVEFGSPITIGDNCWIGGHAVINPGVTLGNNVVVASGAVVTKSFGDNVLLGGVPAKIIKRLEK